MMEASIILGFYFLLPQYALAYLLFFVSVPLENATINQYMDDYIAKNMVLKNSQINACRK